MTFTCSDWRVSYDAVASQSHLTLSPLSRTQNVEKQPLLLGNTEYLTLSTHMWLSRPYLLSSINRRLKSEYLWWHSCSVSLCVSRQSGTLIYAFKLLKFLALRKKLSFVIQISQFCSAWACKSISSCNIRFYFTSAHCWASCSRCNKVSRFCHFFVGYRREKGYHNIHSFQIGLFK